LQQQELTAGARQGGLPATGIRYARIASPAPRSTIAALLHETGAVAEIHNTLCAAASVALIEPHG
jgi:hypothetical protein